MGAGHRRGDRPEGDRVAAAGRCCARAAGRSRSRSRRPARTRARCRYGPVLNAAAVLLSVLRERAAGAGRAGHGHAAGHRGLRRAGWTRPPPGWMRSSGRPGSMRRCSRRWPAQDVLAADETPVNVLDRTAAPAGPEEKDPEEKDGKAAAGAPHVLITRTPDGRLTFLQAIGSRRKGQSPPRLPASFTGYLITDGYTGYQHLLSRLAGIQQCAPARHPPVPRRHETRPRRPAGLGRGRHHDPARRARRPSRPPAPAGTPPWTSRSSMTCGNATTPPSPPG